MAPLSLLDRYQAAMLLSGTGDALGYKNGSWEFCHNGKEIIKELKSLGGLTKLNIKPPNWVVSDDTVMHLATSEALTKCGNCSQGDLFKEIARNYKACMRDMVNRAPGMTCTNSVHYLKPDRQDWKDGCRIEFNERGGGCGAAMRAMCIGLRYPRESDLSDLIAVSVESGRMTHHHPTGYLGSLAAALFTAYAIQDKPPREWGAGLMRVLPEAKEYVKSQKFYVDENLKAWSYFETSWKKYLEDKGLLDGTKDPKPDNLKTAERDKFYKNLSFSGWGGSSGHDAPMIAYDAILQSGKDWEKLCKRGMFHGGDSDSTGVMAGCWYGAMYGYKGVPEGNYKNLEYKERLEKEAEKLYELAQESQEKVAEDVKQQDEMMENDTTQREKDECQDGKVKDQKEENQCQGEETNKEQETSTPIKEDDDKQETNQAKETPDFLPRQCVIPRKRIMASLLLRYQAAMLLSGAGDALGYKNGSWEECRSGEEILRELKSLGGLSKLNVKPPSWLVSDDTVMHLATSEALTKCGNCSQGDLFKEIARNYKTCMRDMVNRPPGLTCTNSVHDLKPDRPDWKDGCRIEFNERGGGCGAAMRAMCIGLRYPRESDLSDLIAVSVEFGRMTHHHPTGYLGSLAAALFTSYAIQDKPPREWGAGLMRVLPEAKEYVKSQKFYVDENLKAWSYFETSWKKYLEDKGLLDGTKDPKPDNLKTAERDKFYKNLSFSGWGGSSGHDAPMIAYDAILQSGKDWEKLCKRGMFHGGDSDSTGVMAGCWYGAMYGYKGVPEGNYKNLEYKDRLKEEAKKLYELAQESQKKVAENVKQQDEMMENDTTQREKDECQDEKVKDQKEENQCQGEETNKEQETSTPIKEDDDKQETNQAKETPV
uniref:ADP-ribosylhydrolase ARH1 n=1 Tax=Crassostrea virginica TaxID=6565 RepID=A0A8B8CLL2_CRAVI|nr:uncharacterized protein LOC111120236 [Crassostrea virginica]